MRWNVVRTAVALVASLALGVGMLGSEGTASAAPSKSPITIALVTSLTGPGGSEFSDSPQGFRARIALQNAQGGVNGHKIVPLIIDDQTSPAQVVTGVQSAISKGALGIVSVTPLFFEAAKYPQQADIPVTGGFFDGPEWGTQPYTNMFASDVGSVDPKYPVNTQVGSFLKAHGGTTIGSYGYSISPSSTRAAVATAQAFQHAGGKTGVLDTSVPFGGVDFTSTALAGKQKNIDAVWAGMDNNSNFALATALKQAGAKVKAMTFPTGYESDLINGPAWQAVQGAYFDIGFRPTTQPNAGTQQLVAALQKYQGRPPSKFPTYEIYESWLGADLMIRGLQLAGPNPTSAAVIKKLRGITSYNANGLLPDPINYSTIFGHDLQRSCGWYFQAQPKGFVPVPGAQPWCGTDIPGTSTAQAGS
jgi:branched-chain amino acid transport system substrate-binding protein